MPYRGATKGMHQCGQGNSRCLHKVLPHALLSCSPIAARGWPTVLIPLVALHPVQATLQQAFRTASSQQPHELHSLRPSCRSTDSQDRGETAAQPRKVAGDPWQGHKQRAERLCPRGSEMNCYMTYSIVPLMTAENIHWQALCAAAVMLPCAPPLCSTNSYPSLSPCPRHIHPAARSTVARHHCPGDAVVICLIPVHPSAEAGRGAQEEWQTSLL